MLKYNHRAVMNIEIKNEIVSQAESSQNILLEKVKFIDLFCGIGSFHHSFQNLGWECVMACDIDKAVKETYKANYGMTPMGDITEIEPNSVPNYDILCAGFPCFVAGTQTLTKQGYKKIEDVEITDLLLTHTGKFQKIVNLQRKIYNGTLLDIRVKYRPNVISATEEHPFYVREKKGPRDFGPPVWKKANELTMNDYFGMVINSPVEVLEEGGATASVGNTAWAYNRQRMYLKMGRLVSIQEVFKQQGEYYLQQENKGDGEDFFIENGYVWFSPTSITKRETEETPVYNFEVETDNSYVVENVIVHNCQPFSQCGQHKGFDDKRGTLFFNIMKFVEHHRPKIMVLENVQGLLNHDGGKTFDKIYSDIQTAGYTVVHRVIKCSDYGLPQMRKRLIILGVRIDSELIPYTDALLNFEEYRQEKTLSELLGKNFEKTTAYTIRCGGKGSPIHDKHNWDGYMVDGKEYRLTKEDCLKIQGFPPDFRLCGTNRDQWKQLGNTVPTIFTEIIGKNIKKYI